MRLKILLTTALSLITSAIAVWTANAQPVTAQAAKSTNFTISLLPFPSITTPGTYLLTGNLSFTSGTGINVSTAVGGPVVVDLKGFTITGPGANSTGINIVFNIASSGSAVGYGLYIFNGQSSTFNNCTFNNALYGIADTASAGGNSYNNNSFVYVLFPLIVEDISTFPLVLDRLQFAPPPSN